MANVKISELPVATSLSNGDSFPVVQGGVTKQAARSVLFASPTFTGTTTADLLTATGDVTFDGGAFVFNESGADKDARFEGDTDANLLFLDASTDRAGIGTATPAAKLDVNGAAIVRGFLTPTDAIKLGANTSAPSTTDAFIYRPADNTLAFGTASNERARITSGGDFGINGTPPSDSQFYSKNSAANKFAGTFENHDAGGYGISIGTANTNLAFFYPNASRTGSYVGAITTNGSSTSYVTSSDRRLKEGIAPAADAGPIIDAIEVVQHEWKVGGHTRFGVIAQDLNAVAPEAVSAGDDGDEIEKTWGVDYSKLVPMLIKEIQSLRARVAALEAG